jgi:hypothetical protein
MLTREDEPVQPAIAALLKQDIKFLLSLFGREEDNIVFETAWIVTNICSSDSEFVQQLIEAGLLEALSLSTWPSGLKSPDFEQFVWIVGNLLGDSADIRAQLFDNGTFSVVMAINQGGAYPCVRSVVLPGDVCVHALLFPPVTVPFRVLLGSLCLQISPK